ncbi:hypothetical protein Q8G41_27330, partial [Klebsiella pneumoniae]|uniref:hypothetical protein n=1 Tax=Klebsiella pneumoniae TaxID=573 RepID=UPI0030133D24
LPSANEAPIPGVPNITFNSVDDLSMPARRFWMYPFSPSGTYYSGTGYPTMGQSNGNFQAADLLMTDVVSFDVRVLLAGDTEFRDLGDAQVQA